jgi:LAGLIDADG endonuclease
MGSDNLGGVPRSEEPGNQQERLLQIGWVVGFVDGEGCFSIGFVRQPDRPKRRGYRTGYQVSHDFTVTQGAKSVECLYELRRFFGIGYVYRNTRYDNHTEDLYHYTVCKRDDLISVIVPFFRTNLLRTSKREDFDKFRRCLEIIATGRHRTPAGLAEIAELAQTMNRRKSRADLIRILRDHTSDTPTG